MSSLCLFILFLVRCWLLNGHLLGKSCSLGHMFSMYFDYLLFSLFPIRDVGSDFGVSGFCNFVSGLICNKYIFNFCHVS